VGRSLGTWLSGCFIIIILVFAIVRPAFYDSNKTDEIPWWAIPLDQRASMDLNLTGSRSQLHVQGQYAWTGPTEHYVSVDLPLSEQDVGYPEDSVMHIALWLPDVLEGMKVPVIATIHPYYDFGGEGIIGIGGDSAPNTVPDGGVGEWVLDQFVPHGYALAQVSTFGTGKSTHCQDVKGLGEQIGIQKAVDWLGKQEWSNGNVGVIGKSYAGTTTWEAAQNPSEHLKTIVPISGSIGVQQMFYRNGSSESRAMVYDALYQGATTDATSDDLRMCSDDLIGPASPFTTWMGAEFGGAQWNDYWEERHHLPDVIENYEGSVYLVWGMQDWNVDPYHAFPALQQLKNAGIPVRGIMGQWAHDYPDQPDKHGELESGYGKEAYPSMSRMDWAVDLFWWFEYYLNESGPKPGNHVQMQRNDGLWRVEETWPPVDIEWEMIGFDEMNGQGGLVSSTNSVVLETEPLQESIHISGLPTLHLTVQLGACNGGQIFATLRDITDDMRLGHAVMDVRYREGGYDANPALPFQNYLMKMEFNPMDVHVPAGHTLALELTESGEDYLSSPCAVIGMQVIVDESSSLCLPLVERNSDDERWFDVPAWWEHQEDA